MFVTRVHVRIYLRMCYSVDMYMYMYFGITHGLLTYSRAMCKTCIYENINTNSIPGYLVQALLHVVMLLLYTCTCIHTHGKR